MSANYKNFPFHLIGCAVLPLVGAYTQSVKAVLPDPSVVKKHWRKNPKIFQETFEVLFTKAEWLPFWGEDFPDWFKEQNGALCKIKINSGDLSFHTLDDLEKLKCDAELKKIIKVLGSTEFLEKVLSGEVVKSIFAHATGGEEFRLEIIFRPHFKDAFFNPLGKGSLDMTIYLKYFSEEAMRCSFIFDFEKENNITVLKNCDASYDVGNNGIKMEYLKKTNKRPDFPWDAVREAKKNFSSGYAKLRDDFKEGRKKYKDCKICSIAKDAMDCFLNFRGDFDGQGPYVHIGTSMQDVEIKERHRRFKLKRSYHISSLLNIIITEDFLKGIFGKKFWNIFENGDTLCDNCFSRADFKISEYGGGLKVSFLLKNKHRGNMTEDVVYFYGDDKDNWEWLDSNYINFVFLYDPSEDKISHVRLCDKLILNDEIIQRGETEETLLPIDSEDFYRPASFYLEANADNIVEHYRRLTGNGKITLDWVVNDIVKTCYCFNKDVKSSVQILSRWAQGKKAPRIFVKMTEAFHCLEKAKLWRALKEIKKAAMPNRLKYNPLLDEPE
ncbi:MAG: hypothetical protein IJ793_04350 [Opitutales bacterium]|nr:hypothetical protein [Opitutales bacterium]